MFNVEYLHLHHSAVQQEGPGLGCGVDVPISQWHCKLLCYFIYERAVMLCIYIILHLVFIYFSSHLKSPPPPPLFVCLCVCVCVFLIYLLQHAPLHGNITCVA